MAGIRLSAVYVIAWTTLASYVGAGGLGDFIFSGLTLFNVPMIVMGALPVTVIALVIDFILARLEKFVQPKTKSQYKGKSGSKEVELDIQGKKKNTVKKVPLLFLSLFFFFSDSSPFSGSFLNISAMKIAAKPAPRIIATQQNKNSRGSLSGAILYFPFDVL